jgi:hypothetical protein
LKIPIQKYNVLKYFKRLFIFLPKNNYKKIEVENFINLKNNIICDEAAKVLQHEINHELSNYPQSLYGGNPCLSFPSFEPAFKQSPHPFRSHYMPYLTPPNKIDMNFFG